ncbi:ATP synthase subunit C lysine N-methyltransferase [Anopheles nili]|uniref:ATP synthase subunit C lysine N-methyltransferase n=1 Tax=Anopheles nili TaxID=185578 RepID=UPI00237B3D2B|nr:ATP synthase subunit C lysine N-methyltransferase [Anopheles nili]
MNIARGMEVLGPALTLDTLVETLVIGVGTLSGVQRLELLSGFAVLSAVVNYVVFMTFYPACLSLILELTHSGTNRVQKFGGENLIRRVLLQEDSKPNPVAQRVKLIMSSGGKILIGITGGIAVGLSIVCFPFVAPALRKHCLPFVPATPNQIRNVLSFVKPSANGSRLLDIGSGDGRIVIAAARSQPGLKSDGVELNPWLVYYSRLAALRGGVLNRTSFFRKDLWRFSLTPYDHIVIFGVEQMMEELEKKILSESAPGATIIACRFPFPSMKPVERIEEGVDSVWVYRPTKQQGVM